MDVETEQTALSPDARRTIQQHLTAARARIVDRWLSAQFDASLLTRWGVAGVQEQNPANLKRVFVEPLFDLFVQWIGDAEPRLRAVYRDERLRYAPHQASPEDRAKFFQEVVPSDEAAVLEAVPEALRAGLAAVLAELHAPLVHPSKGGVRMLAVGDCLMNEIRVFLPDVCRSRGFEADVRCLYFSALAGRDISTAQIKEFLSEQKMDVIAFSFLSYEGLPVYSALLREADKLSETDLDQRVTGIVGLMRRFLDDLRQLTDAPFLVHNASGLPLTRFRKRLPFLSPLSSGRRRAVEKLNVAIADLVANTPNTILVDEMAVAESVGPRAAMESAVPHTKEAQFHTARFGEYLAIEYADVLASYDCMRKAKVLAVDFDNTLWEGVMADGPVGHHTKRQALLRTVKDAGMLLVAVSKNDPANIRWTEMTLTPEDFVLQKIGWNLKVESITAAAAQLDLGIDSFVFLDDNPAECELVRSQLPKVRVLDANDEFAWRSVERLLRFPNTKDTDEARSRTELYRQQAQRQEALTGAFDFAAMMDNLGLALEFRTATSKDLDRVTELVQRTNQFNTTTKRYTKQQLQDFMSGSTHRVYVASLADKFGKLGLVLTVIVERREDEAVVDSFVMSCRAMGFQLEQAVLRLVLDTEADDLRWRGLFVPTDRNTPSADFFSSCGFARVENDWVLDSPLQGPAIPAWFSVRAEQPVGG